MVVKINDKNLFEMEHDSNHRAWDILRRLREGEGLSISDYEFLVGALNPFGFESSTPTIKLQQ